jgi:hypothetical protein
VTVRDAADRDMADRRKFIAAMAAFAAAPALGREVNSITLPDAVRLAKEGPPLVIAGVGLFRFLFIRYYVCGLYVSPGLKSAEAILAADAPRRLALVALRGISAFEFLWGLDRGLSDNLAESERYALAGELDRVRQTIRAIDGIERGARVALDYLPGSGVRILVDDVVRAAPFGSKALADALLRVWIGERPLDRALKEALLAG